MALDELAKRKQAFIPLVFFPLLLLLRCELLCLRAYPTWLMREVAEEGYAELQSMQDERAKYGVEKSVVMFVLGKGKVCGVPLSLREQSNYGVVPTSQVSWWFCIIVF
uniref:Uncharacterized protein n=1 Tax=Paramoeba aestuarina TaxID=180227 RepID=A0A7S4N6I2_9EUKA